MGSRAPKPKVEKKAPAPPKGITAYKGLDKDFCCRGYQYVVGETYKTDATISLCQSGFHACLSPLDTFNYYDATNGSRYAVVTMRDVDAETSDDTKRVCREITIEREISVNGLILAEIEYINAQPKTKKSSGDCSMAASSGNSSKCASSGYHSRAASSGDCSTAASSGDHSRAASSGDCSMAASSGNSSKCASSGYHSRAASSGDCSMAASSGNSSTAASSGDCSMAASSGNSSKCASSGDCSTTECDTNGFACIAGINGAVKGNACSALSMGYKDAKDRNRIAVAYVGEDGIEAGKWYKCDNAGKFHEVKS